jgi:hypothetical protein
VAPTDLRKQTGQHGCDSQIFRIHHFTVITATPHGRLPAWDERIPRSLAGVCWCHNSIDRSGSHLRGYLA